MSTHGRDLPWGIIFNNPGQLVRPHDESVPHAKQGDRLIFRNMTHGLEGMAVKMRAAAAGSSMPQTWFFAQSYCSELEADQFKFADDLADRLSCGAKATADHKIDLSTAWRRLDAMRAIILILNGVPPKRFSIGGEWFHPATLWSALERSARL